MIPLLIILTGALCGALPTVLWWRERNLRINSQGWAKFYKFWMNSNTRQIRLKSNMANDYREKRNALRKAFGDYRHNLKRIKPLCHCLNCGRYFKQFGKDYRNRDKTKLRLFCSASCEHLYNQRP